MGIAIRVGQLYRQQGGGREFAQFVGRSGARKNILLGKFLIEYSIESIFIKTESYFFSRFSLFAFTAPSS